MNPLPWRKAAAKELAKMASLYQRLDWRVSECHQLRERVFADNIEVRADELRRVIELLDAAVVLLAAARDGLEAK